MKVNNNSQLMQILGDKDKFIKKATESQEKRLEEIKDQVKESGEKAQALSTLKNLVQDFTKTSASIISPINDPFNGNKAEIQTTENSATSYIEVTTLPQADKGSFSVRVNQIATSSKMVIQGPDNGGINENPGMDGTLTVTISGAANVVVIGANDNATQIVNKINAQLAANAVRAKAVPIKSNGVIYIEIIHLDQGANAMTFNWNPNGVTPQNTLAQRSNVTGQAAIIEVDGVQITQNNNLFQDVLPGITVKAIAPNTGGDATKKQTVVIENDPSKAINELRKFTDAHNNLAKFVAKMTEKKSATEYAPTAFLHSTHEIIQAQSLLDTLSIGITKGNYHFSSLSSIGLGLEDSSSPEVPAGTKLLNITDPEKFTNAVKNDPESFAALFRGKVDITNNPGNHGSTLRFSTMSKLLPPSVLAKNITITTNLGLVGGDVDAVTAVIPGDNGRPNTNIIGTYRVSGGYGYITFPGTVLEGLNLGYDPKGLVNSVDNFTVTISQGLAESSFYNSLYMVSENEASGSLISAMAEASREGENLAETQKNLEEKIKLEIAKTDVIFGQVNSMDLLNNMMIELLSQTFNNSSK